MDVRFEGVRFFRGRHEVLDVPGLTFAAGRTTALLGPNGSGKTTILRLIAALERPSAGQVWIGGQLARPGREPRAQLAYAFQQPAFLAARVRANLDLALRLRGVPAPARQARLGEAAAACGIEHLLDRDAHRLSGGEAQRANLARALCLRAPVTLLDEPLSGLDAPVRRQMLHDLPGLLRDFATTTILVTHDRDEALRLADDLVVLMEGRVRAAGPKQEVMRRPPDGGVAEFLGYVVIETDAGAVGIAPGSLHAGEGGVRFEMEVEALVDLGTHQEVAGRLCGLQVSVPLPAGAAHPGPRLTVSAPAGSVVRFARRDHEDAAKNH